MMALQKYKKRFSNFMDLSFNCITEERYIYVKNKNDDVTLVEHTLCCIMGAYMGVLSGAFLGLTWPISLPIFIGRYIDKNKK
jgi:hypothetical protein